MTRGKEKFERRDKALFFQFFRGRDMIDDFRKVAPRIFYVRIDTLFQLIEKRKEGFGFMRQLQAFCPDVAFNQLNSQSLF